MTQTIYAQANFWKSGVSDGITRNMLSTRTILQTGDGNTKNVR